MSSRTTVIDITQNMELVNGQALDEPYVQELTHDDFGAEGIQLPLVVKKNHVFLMGDNRNDSYGSRYRGIGQVDERSILGKVPVFKNERKPLKSRLIRIIIGE